MSRVSAGIRVLQAKAPLRLGSAKAGVGHVPQLETRCLQQLRRTLVLFLEQAEVCGDIGIGLGQGQASQRLGFIRGRFNIAPGGIKPGGHLLAGDLGATVNTQQPLGAQGCQIGLDQLGIEGIHTIRRILHIFHREAGQVHG